MNNVVYKQFLKYILLIVILLLNGAYIFSDNYAEAASVNYIMIEDFNLSTPGKFPENWETYNMTKGVLLYKVCKEQNNLYLNADVIDDSIHIGKYFDWDIKKHPYLAWKWRIKKHPEGSNEKIEDKHDSAACIYVFLENKFSILPKYVKYIWSKNLKAGSRFFFKKNKAVVVMRAGEEHMNEWLSESRNVYEDLKFFYGDKTPPLLGVGILTDSNNTHTKACADYDDICISVKSLN